MQSESVEMENEWRQEDRTRKLLLLMFLMVIAAVLVVGNVFYGAVVYTRHALSYCIDCHQFNEPAAMWERSDRHAEWMTCPQCHGLLPGQKGRLGAFSAHASTVNPNCMGCHASIEDGRPIEKVAQVKVPAAGGEDGGRVLYEWPLQELMFKWHIQNRVCLCTDCHRNVAHEKGVVPSGHQPKMAYCKECHYHAAKDDYVKMTPLPELGVKETGPADKENKG